MITIFLDGLLAKTYLSRSRPSSKQKDGLCWLQNSVYLILEQLLEEELGPHCVAHHAAYLSRSEVFFCHYK